MSAAGRAQQSEGPDGRMTIDVMVDAVERMVWVADFGTVPNSATTEPALLPQAELDAIAQRLRDEAKRATRPGTTFNRAGDVANPVRAR
jgi:hypothetical protein